MKNLLSPAVMAVSGFVMASALSIAGMYLLAGTGWAFMVAAIHFYLIAAIIFRGLARG
ncbi:hypothetical protein ACW4YW_15095 [Methylobacillus pratensis]